MLTVPGHINCKILKLNVFVPIRRISKIISHPSWREKTFCILFHKFAGSHSPDTFFADPEASMNIVVGTLHLGKSKKSYLLTPMVMQTCQQSLICPSPFPVILFEYITFPIIRADMTIISSRVGGASAPPRRSAPLPLLAMNSTLPVFLECLTRNSLDREIESLCSALYGSLLGSHHNHRFVRSSFSIRTFPIRSSARAISCSIGCNALKISGEMMKTSSLISV